MITVDEQLEVASPPSEVWRLLSDPRAVVECVPGARLAEYSDDGTFEGVVTVKFGPLRVEFTGSGTLEFDSSAMRGRITAKGKDGRGKTRVGAVASFVVTGTADLGASVLALDGTIKLTGPLAATIEGGASAVVKGMSRQFAESLARRCAVLASEQAGYVPNEIPVRVWLRGAVSGLRAALRLAWGAVVRRIRKGGYCRDSELPLSLATGGVKLEAARRAP